MQICSYRHPPLSLSLMTNVIYQKGSCIREIQLFIYRLPKEFIILKDCSFVSRLRLKISDKKKKTSCVCPSLCVHQHHDTEIMLNIYVSSNVRIFYLIYSNLGFLTIL